MLSPGGVNLRKLLNGNTEDIVELRPNLRRNKNSECQPQKNNLQPNYHTNRGLFEDEII